MFEKIKRAYSNVANEKRARKIRRSDEWGEVRSGFRFTVKERTEQGIRVCQKNVDRYEHTKTGEIVDTYRQDVTTEWYSFADAEDWPEYAERLCAGEPEVWGDDTDAVVGFRGMMMNATWFVEE